MEILRVLLDPGRNHYCPECVLELIEWMVADGVPLIIDMLVKILEFRFADIDIVYMVRCFLENFRDFVPAHLDMMWSSILGKACGASVRAIVVINDLINWRRDGDQADRDYLDCLTQVVLDGNPDLTAELLQFFEELPFKPFDCVISELISGFWVHCTESMDCMRALSAALPLTQKCAELMRAEYQRIKVLYAGFNANKLELEIEEIMATWP